MEEILEKAKKQMAEIEAKIMGFIYQEQTGEVSDKDMVKFSDLIEPELHAVGTHIRSVGTLAVMKRGIDTEHMKEIENLTKRYITASDWFCEMTRNYTRFFCEKLDDRVKEVILNLSKYKRD